MLAVVGHRGLAEQSAPQPQASPCCKSKTVCPIQESLQAREGRGWQSYSQDHWKPYITERLMNDMQDKILTI